MCNIYPVYYYWICFPACFVGQSSLEAAALKGAWRVMESDQLYTHSQCSSQMVGVMQYVGELTGKYRVCIGRLCCLQFLHTCSCCWNTVFWCLQTKILIGFLGGKRGWREAMRTIKGLKTVLSKEKVTEWRNWAPSTHLGTQIWYLRVAWSKRKIWQWLES